MRFRVRLSSSLLRRECEAAWVVSIAIHAANVLPTRSIALSALHKKPLCHQLN